jgi:hypothetical protein
VGDGVMVAYSFRPRFVHPIRVGLGVAVGGPPKLQTIRAPRRDNRHARPGNSLQLYQSMRTKSCRLIGLTICDNVEDITLKFRSKGHGRSDVVECASLGTLDRPNQLDIFAKLDGFIDWMEMRQFWRDVHPDVDVFVGVIIRWPHLPAEASSSAGT